MTELTSKNENKTTINSYKGLIFYFEKILKTYYSEDKTYLFFEIKKLKKKLISLESLLVTTEKFKRDLKLNLQGYYYKFFHEFQIEFLDFLIFLKWNNFGAIRLQLQTVCKENTTVSCVDRENYKILLKLINEV